MQYDDLIGSFYHDISIGPHTNLFYQRVVILCLVYHKAKAARAGKLLFDDKVGGALLVGIHPIAVAAFGLCVEQTLPEAQAHGVAQGISVGILPVQVAVIIIRGCENLFVIRRRVCAFVLKPGEKIEGIFVFAQGYFEIGGHRLRHKQQLAFLVFHQRFAVVVPHADTQHKREAKQPYGNGNQPRQRDAGLHFLDRRTHRPPLSIAIIQGFLLSVT